MIAEAKTHPLTLISEIIEGLGNILDCKIILDNVHAGGRSWAAKVGDKTIKMSHFANIYNRQLERIRQQFGGKVDEKLMESLNIKFRVLSGLVQNKILAAEAAENLLNVSNEELVQTLMQVPAFQKDGKFDMDYYKGFLAYNKFTINEFEGMF